MLSKANRRSIVLGYKSVLKSFEYKEFQFENGKQNLKNKRIGKVRPP